MKRFLRQYQILLILALMTLQDGYITTMESLQEEKNIQSKREKLMAALIKAVERGETSKVQFLIKQNLPIDKQDPLYGTTPLMRAASAGHTEIVKILIESGADLDLKDVYNNTALFLAVINNKDINTAKALIDAGADVNIHGDWRQTGYRKEYIGGKPVLNVAIERSNVELIPILVNAAANLDAKDLFGKTAFDKAQANPNPLVLKTLHDSIKEYEIQQKLLKEQEDVAKNKKRKLTQISENIAYHPNDPAAAFAQRELKADGEPIKRAIFTTDSNLKKILIGLINDEKKGMSIAIYTFTEPDIAQAVINAQKRGVQIEVIADGSQADCIGSTLLKLIDSGIPVYIWRHERTQAIMHNKFALFDSTLNGHTLVWTGSYNFTKAASIANQENVLVLEDSNLMTDYRKEFAHLKEQSTNYSFSQEVPSRQEDPSCQEGSIWQEVPSSQESSNF